MSQWSLNADLNRNHAERLKARSAKSWAERGCETSVELGTIERLAKVAKVSAAWLGRGQGDPSDMVPDAVEHRYHEMPKVLRFARDLGIPEDFISAWELALDYEGQPDALVLFDSLRFAWAEHRRRVQGTRKADRSDL